MAHENWQRVREVFDAALRQDPGDRQNYLNEACGDDKKLLSEVESLFSSLAKSDEFLETPAVAHVADIIESTTRPLALGTRFGHYELIQQIGSGGMGQVYLAKDQKLDRRVAIKILHEKFSRDESNLKRFVREAKTASALNHPNILVIHEIGESEAAHYIVSEFIEGRTLREVLTQSQMNLGEVLDVAIQIARALSAAHGAHLIHRDIKPENVMLRPDGYIKVLDFGLAKLIEQQNKSFLGLEESTLAKGQTAKGVILGTINYMSPEQAKGERIDERTDIFSLGVVIYEMVTGRTPFAQDSMSETLANLISAEPQPLSRFAINVPDELTRIVSKMLRKDKDERYQTMKDVLTDLKDLRANLTLATKVERTPELGGITATAALQQATRDAEKVTANTQYSFLRRIVPHKGLVGIALVTLLAGAIGLGYYFVYSRRPPSEPDDSKVAAGLPLRTSFKSLAVLPLDNFSGDSAQDYLADGMTEALITELAKIGSLRVISRQSIMQYKTARKPLPDIAKELNVDVIVTGSVQRSRDKIGITAQLIRATTDQHLWANQYERQVRDVISLQREVARAIAAEINVKLTPQEQGLLANARPVNTEALDAYLKGRDYFNQGRNLLEQGQGTDLLKTSVGYFEQATRIDPSYALAYAGLARANHWLAGSGLRELYPRAKKAATRALEIDETLAEAHGALARVLHRFDWDFARSENEYERAIELNPSYSDAHHGYALYLSDLGRHDQAIREIELAQALDPLTLPLKTNVAFIYLYARQNDRAIEHFQRLADTQPKNLNTHYGLGMAYIYNGMHAEGMEELRKLFDLSEGDALAKTYLAWAYAVSGDRDKAIKMLDEILNSRGGAVSKVTIAEVYTALGNKDQAFAWLEKAYQEHSGSLLSLKRNPSFDSLRSDPRFTDLLQRIGFPS
jgi:serine/threonine-protein kinase